MTNTIYGTWCNTVNTYASSPDDEVEAYITGGGSHWRELLETSGALDRIKSEYRDEIDARLPPDVALVGEQFIGPAEPEEGEFDGYVDADGELDIAALVEDIDLGKIVEKHDPDIHA